MNIDEFLNEMYEHSSDTQDNPAPFSLVRELAQYIYDAVDESSKTLETGAGLSTIIFALRGTRHVCITPCEKEIINITTYCNNRNISLEKVNFQIQKSENVLPYLQLKDLDLVLIDGRHAFPTPFIDWYYASRGLKTGGTLIVDDTNIWTGKALEGFLCLEPEWKLIKSIPYQAAIFIKRAEGSHDKEFHQQPFVMRNSRYRNGSDIQRFRVLHSAIRHVCRGEIVTLAKKIMHRLHGGFYGSFKKCEERMPPPAPSITTNNEPQFWAQQYNRKYDSGNTFSYDYPEKAMVSLTSRCNLCCWHCSRADQPGIAVDMPRELLEYIAKNILVHCQYLRIGGADIGEPLFSKDFNYFFKILDRKNNPRLKEVSLITNLTLVDREKADIIAENVDVLEISIEGIGAAYSKTRHFPWEKIAENIKLIAEYRKEKQRNKPLIVLAICVMLSNLENLMEVFALKEIGVDRILFREFTAFTREKEGECLWHDPQKTASYIRKFEERSQQTGMPVTINFKDKYNPEKKDSATGVARKELVACYLPWTCVAIDSRGTISCCCRELDLAKLNTGREQFFALWNTKKFRSVRRNVNRKKPYLGCLGCEVKMAHWTSEEIEMLQNKYLRYTLKRIATKYAVVRALHHWFRRLFARVSRKPYIR